MTVLLFFVMVGASTAWGQANVYAERNGLGAAPCAATDPCDLELALSTAASATDTVFVRVREKGAMTRIDDDLSFGGRTIAIYVDDEDDVTQGMIALEGDATINDAVTVVKGTTLYLQGDVTLSGSTAELLMGDVQLGGAGSLELTLGATCPGGGFTIEKLGINDDVEVDDTCTTAADNEITITNSLNVKSGDLDLGGATLSLEPVASTDAKVPDGSVSIAAGSKIAGSERLMLNPQAPAGGSVTGKAKPDTLTLLGKADGTTEVDGLAEFLDDPSTFDGSALVVGTAFPSGSAGNAAVAGDIGTVLDYRARREADATATPAVTAVQARLRILLFVQTAGFNVTSGDCFNIKGKGELELDVVKDGQGGACISVPNVGDGGTTDVMGGALILSGVTRLDGRLRNLGNARTELRGVGQIAEDLVIDGITGAAGSEVYAGVVGSDMIRQVDCSGSMTSHGRTAGVYIYGATTIVGDVTLDNTDPDTTPNTDAVTGTACKEGLYFSGVSNAASPGTATAKAKKGSIMSTVLGAVESSGRSYVSLGDHNRYHSVALEDDLTSDGELTVAMATPAEYMADQNLCAVNTAAGKGNSVVFTGQYEQDVDIENSAGAARSLTLAAVRVAKSDARPVQELGAVRIGTGTLNVTDLLEVERGTLTTEGNLALGSGTVLRIGEGRVHSGDATTAYSGTPVALHYTNSTDLMTGAEIPAPVDGKAFVMPLMDVSTTATVTLSQPVDIGEHLHLSNGTLKTGGNALGFARQATVHHGMGELEVGAGGSIKYPAGTKYDPALHGITVAYKTGKRTAGAVFPTGTAAPGPAHITKLVVDGTACKTDPAITLNNGFSRVDGDIEITRGTLDINGQHLVAMSASGASQKLTLGEKGYICDSGAGSCGGGGEADLSDDLLDVAEGLESISTMKDVRARQELQESIANLQTSWASASKTAQAHGAVHFVGNGNTTVDMGTKANSKSLPAVQVKRKLDAKKGAGTVTIMSSSAVAAGTAQNSKENLDMVSVGGLAIDHGNVTLGSSVDVFNVMGGLVQKGGMMSLATGADNLNPEGRKKRMQRVVVGSSAMAAHHQVSGGTVNMMGGSVMVTGSYVQGNEIMMDSTGAVIADTVGTTATVNLNGGEHNVMGDFYVGPGKGKTMNSYTHGAGCGSERNADNAGNTTVGGDYHFGGTGECHQDDQYTAGQQGLSGSVTFAGMECKP